MHAEIMIRQAVEEDSLDLLSLIRAAMTLYAARSGIDTPLESLQENLADVRQHIRQDHVLVAEHKGHLIGTVRLVLRDDDIAYFSRFAVHPQLQQTGVGRMLFQAAEQWLRNQGIRVIELHTALSNQELVKFYQARGFDLVSAENTRDYARGLFRKKLTARDDADLTT